MAKRYYKNGNDRYYENGNPRRNGSRTMRRYYEDEQPNGSVRYYKNSNGRSYESNGTTRYYENEPRGVARYYEKEMYAGPAMRERMEYDSSMMIREDRSAMANLPQNVVLRYYPDTPYQNDRVPDTIVGIDVQVRDDMLYQKRGNFPEKY
jgi:hypothetical protein